MGQIEDLQAKGFGSHGGRQHLTHDNIQPLGKRVLVCRMHFGETKSKGGIILIDDDGSEGGIHPRWAKIYAIGPKQEDVKVGQWILISHGRWSRAFKIENKTTNEEVRMVDEDDILLVSDEEPEDNRKQAGYVNMGGTKQMSKLPGND
jgi:co-chaperonin GroES (HSP10)